MTHTRIIVSRYGEPDALQVVEEKDKGEYKWGRNHFPARGGPAEFVVRPSYLVDRKKGSPWITRYASRFTRDALSPSPHPHHIQNDGYASDFALDLSQRTDQINAYGSRCVAECYDLWWYIQQRRASMMRWLTHGGILVVMLFLFGCLSSPTVNWTREKIGFTRAPQPGGTETLWVMNGDGSGQSQLNLGADGNSSLTWSPDGNYIAFESIRDGNHEIYTAQIISNADKTYSAQDIQRRTTTPADDSSPAWSHDCALLAFSSNRANQTRYNIYQLDLNNNNVTPITNGNYQDFSPSWSPDGSKIAFTRKVGDTPGEIYIRVMSSGQEIRLTNNSVNDTDPSWSPINRIIFSRHSEDGSRAALFEMDAVDANGDGNGDHLDPISTPHENEYDRKPEYTRNGKAIVFFRNREAGGRGPGDVYKLLIQDGTITEPLLNLTETNPQHEHGATWKRNGICLRKWK